MLAPVRTAAPAEMAVTLPQARAHCHLDSSDSDTELSIYLNAAIEHLDGWGGILGRCLVTQTWRQDLDSFDDPRLRLGPVASIASITYYDADEVRQTLADTVYALRFDEDGAYVGLKPGQAWPSVYTRDDAIGVTFVTGVAAGEVPAPLKAAILLLTGDLYANRETVVTGVPSSAIAMTPTVDRLIAPFRRVRL